MSRTAVCLAACLLAAAVFAGAGAAVGPSPGTVTGGAGISTATQRIVALPGSNATAVAAIRRSDGRVLRYATVGGRLGIPLVTISGEVGGLSADGRTLVVADATIGQPLRRISRFAVLRLPSLAVEREIVLRGDFAFDAISPGGATLYLIEHRSVDDLASYVVRALDVATGTLLPGKIADRREQEATMSGYPIRRAAGAGDRWVYTLYQEPNGSAFVHALDTVGRRAVCIDLPASIAGDLVTNLRLHVTPDGSRLVIGGRGRGGPLAAIDARSQRLLAASG